MRSTMRVVAVLAACILSALAGGIFMTEARRPTCVAAPAPVPSPAARLR